MVQGIWVQVGYVGEVLLSLKATEEMIQYFYHFLASMSLSTIFKQQLINLGSGL